VKHLRYLSYVLRHKWFVLLAGLKVSAPLWRLIIHDWSKFLPSEWNPYVQNFYGDDSHEALDVISEFSLAELAPYGFYTKDRFTVAWNHHQKRNAHHWQYWLHTQDSGEQFPLPIPEQIAREMVADWMGAGRAITGRWEVSEWYESNKEKIQLRYSTRRFVESLLSEATP